MSTNDLIFIVDDDAIYQLITQKEIQFHGPKFASRSFYNASDALIALQNEYDSPPSILLLDLNMPLMDGWQFLEAYRNLPEHITQQIKLYVVSSSIDYRDIDRAKTYSAVKDFIIKPIMAPVFQQILQ